MIIALFIGFLCTIDFFVPFACRRFKRFVIIFVAVQQLQKKRPQGLLSYSPHVFFKIYAMGRYYLADRLRCACKKIGLWFAPVADGRMDFWLPVLIGVQLFRRWRCGSIHRQGKHRLRTLNKFKAHASFIRTQGRGSLIGAMRIKLCLLLVFCPS